MKITVKLQPQELTSLMDKNMIINIREAFVEATQQAKEDGEELEGTYASIAVKDFVELLKSSKVIPPDVCDKITEHIDVNDDGDIDFDEFINFVLAAESNLEYSKQQGMERFSLSTMKELDESQEYTKQSLYTLSYTGHPLSIVAGGGSRGEVHLYNSMTFRLLCKFPYESKTMAMRNNLMTGIMKKDQPVLKARLKESTNSGKDTLDRVELVSSCVLPYTPSMLVIGAADASFAVFDISSQTSRLDGAVGRINSLSSPPTCMVAVQDRLKHYGERADKESSEADTGSDFGESTSTPGQPLRVGVPSSAPSSQRGVGPSVPLGDRVRGAGTVSGTSSPSGKGRATGTSSDEDDESVGTKKNPVQTIYIGCSDGRLYWLPLDRSFGTSTEKDARKKNKKTFEDSVLLAAGKGALLTGRPDELDSKYKSHEQKASEILGFRRYLSKGEVEELPRPWERPGRKAALKRKKATEEEAKQAKLNAREEEKLRQYQLPFLQLHTDAITKILYLSESDCVVCSSLDGTISFFSHKAKTQLRHFKGTYREACKNGIACMAHSAKNKFIVSSAERALYAWDVQSEEITHRLTDLPALVSQVEVDDRNDIIVALLAGGTVMVWGSLNFELRQSIDGRGNIDDMRFGRDSEIVARMLLFDNKEIARTENEKVAKVEKALAEKNPTAALKKKRRKDGTGQGEKYYYTLCLGGDLINLWRFGVSSTGEDDVAAHQHRLGLQSEDIVTALFNSNFKLFIVLYSLGTCKVFSTLSGACMREFVVSETDAFGKLKREKLLRDPETGLIKPVVKNACLDCTQRRLMVMLTDDRVKVWNFFAGQEIDEVYPQLPLAVAKQSSSAHVPLHGDKETVTGNGCSHEGGGGGGGGDGSECLTALEEASRQLAEEKGTKSPVKESSTTMSMVEMSGVEKRGREKFTIRSLVLGCTGEATVNIFHDKGETISESAMSIFRWTRRPVNYRGALQEHDKSHSLGGLSTGLESEASERAGDSTAGSNEVLWNVYMDFRGNAHNDGLSSGSGNGMDHGRDRGSYLTVGYGNGTCTIFDANSVKVLSRIDPSSVGTLLHGMKLKVKSQTQVDAAEAQGRPERASYVRSRVSAGSSNDTQGLGDEVESANLPCKAAIVTIDAAVGVYEPLVRVIIGACSDRYLKIFDVDSGAILCSMSYIHEEAGMEAVYTGSSRHESIGSITSAGGRATRDDEERIKTLKIHFNAATHTFILAAGYDNGTVRVWELDSKILLHLKEQLKQAKEDALEEDAETEDEEVENDAVRPPSPTSQQHHSKPGVTFDGINIFNNRDATTTKAGRTAKLLKGGQLDEVLGIAVCPLTLCEEFIAHTTSTFSLHILHLDKNDIMTVDKGDESALLHRETAVDEEISNIDGDSEERDGMHQPVPPASETNSTKGGRHKLALEALRRQRQEALRPDPTDYKKNPYRIQGTWRDLFKRDKGVKKKVAEDLFSQDFYLISSTLMGESMMWTLDGTFIGQFGGKTASKWDLRKPESWPNRWLVGTDDGDDEAERAKRERKKEERPRLSTRTTLEMEVERALDTGKLRAGRKLSSEELNASVMRMLHESSIKPPVSVQHSGTYRRLNLAHPLVPTEELPFDSSRVTRMDL